MEKQENNLINLDEIRDKKKGVEKGTHKRIRQAEKLADKLVFNLR